MTDSRRATLHVGDALSTLRSMADESVACCVTSPPYWGLRDYGIPGQVGLEDSIDEHVARMVEAFAEVRRVLAKDGSLWLNLGDSYVARRGGGVGSSSSINGTRTAHAYRAANAARRPGRGLPHKNLVGMPWRVALALQADGWLLRSDIVWHKPNPLPDSTTDRPTKSHEYVFLLSRSPSYHYDQDAIRTDLAPKTETTWGSIRRCKDGADQRVKARKFQRTVPHRAPALDEHGNPKGANARTVWTIPPAQYDGPHFAVMPERLVEPCIAAGCPPGGTVLDPFAGTGTVGVVAHRMGRRFVGIEINPETAELARRRITEDSPLFASCEVLTAAAAEAESA